MSVMNQVVDVRYASRTRQFTSEEDERQYNAEVAAFRARIPSDVKYVVAPGSTILVLDGTRRGAGQAIQAEDIPEQVVTDKHGNQTGSRLGWRIFEEHLHAGRIIENYAHSVPQNSKGTVSG
jgi:hypothetical protein